MVQVDVEAAAPQLDRLVQHLVHRDVAPLEPQVPAERVDAELIAVSSGLPRSRPGVVRPRTCAARLRSTVTALDVENLAASWVQLRAPSDLHDVNHTRPVDQAA